MEFTTDWYVIRTEIEGPKYEQRFRRRGGWPIQVKVRGPIYQYVAHIVIHRIDNPGLADLLCGAGRTVRDWFLRSKFTADTTICPDCMRKLGTPAIRDMLENGIQDKYPRSELPVEGNFDSDYFDCGTRTWIPGLDWYDGEDEGI